MKMVSNITPGQLLIAGLALLVLLALLNLVSPFGVLALLVIILLIRVAGDFARWRTRRIAMRGETEATMAGPLILHILVAAVIAFGGIYLLGLPGLLVYLLASPFIDTIFGGNALDRLPMYGGLGVGFIVNLLWPWCLPVAYAVMRSAKTADRGQKLLIYIGILYGWAVISSFAGYAFVLLGR